MSYETIPVVSEEGVGRTVESVGWVSKYRIISTIRKRYVTALTVRLVSPDGETLVSQYVVPTRFLETEYSLPPITVFLGVVNVAGVSGSSAGGTGGTVGRPPQLATPV